MSTNTPVIWVAGLNQKVRATVDAVANRHEVNATRLNRVAGPRGGPDRVYNIVRFLTRGDGRDRAVIFTGTQDSRIAYTCLHL